MKRRMLFVFGLLLLLAVACAGGAIGERSAVEEAPAALPEMAAAPQEAGDAFYAGDLAAGNTVTLTEDEASSTAAQNQAGQERLIIRNADMSIVATDTEAAMAQIAQMAINGGWVVSSNVYESSETSKTGYIQIRVPAEGFQSVLDAIAGLAVSVESLSTSGQDVTEEYVDLTSQLTNLEATAARVRNFLDDATRVEDALAVNAELSRLESEIAVIKGRMQYLSQSAAFSSITVSITPDELAQPIEVAGWQPKGVAKQAIESLVNALQSLVDLLIWLVIFVLPILVLLAIPLAILIWLIRRLQRRRAATAVAAPMSASAPPEEK